MKHDNTGPGPPDDDSPTEPPDPVHAHATIILTKNELNHSANNLTNHTKEHSNEYSPRQGSLTNSTGSERESDSAYVCDSESPNENLPPDNDVFDWWFHRNTRGSHKSRYQIQ